MEELDLSISDEMLEDVESDESDEEEEVEEIDNIPVDLFSGHEVEMTYDFDDPDLENLF